MNTDELRASLLAMPVSSACHRFGFLVTRRAADVFTLSGYGSDQLSSANVAEIIVTRVFQSP